MSSHTASDALATELVHTLKVLRAAAHSLPRVHEAVDPLSHPLLFALVSGPKRVSDVACIVNNDLSTVSRQASSLHEHGLIVKLSDPDDGRAQLLALSEEGVRLVEAARKARAVVFDDLLTDWSADDVSAFTTFLRTFSEAVQAKHLTHNERVAP